jgi:hypothetical protein
MRLPAIEEAIARAVYDTGHNSPPLYDMAAPVVQNNYKMAVATVIEHFVLPVGESKM